MSQSEAETEEPTEPVLEPEAGEFRYTGLHATTLESGQPIAPGDYVELDEKDAKKNKGLFEDGWLISAEGMAPEPEPEPKTKDKEGGS